MCLFTACAQGYHNSSKLRPHPHAALSSLPFLPLFVFNPTFHFSLPFFQLFFPPTVFTPVFISHALIAVLFLPHFSSHSSCLPSFLFRSLTFISTPLLPLIASRHLYPFLPVLPSLPREKPQTKDAMG